jgi:tetratricopeptide (TPR) repeat protein
VAGIGLCAFWCISGLRNASSKRMLVCMGAVSAGLAASAAHSAVDFVWYIPGCMTMVVVLAACSCRLWQLATEQPARRTAMVPIPRHVGFVSAALLLAVGTWMVKVPAGWALAEPHWERFLMLDQEKEPLPFGMAEPGESPTAEEYRSSLAAKQKAVAELKQVVRWEPRHARAHLRLAEAYLRLFHQKQEMSANVMSVNQLRDAVLASRSEAVPPESRLDSREKLEQWLSVAVGEHYVCLDLALEHARRAVALCPLLGEGYLFLGELCFLEGGRESSKSAYVAQALKVRPFDGTVLLHAGSEAILAGNFDQGLAYWQDAFHRGSIYQAQIIDWLVGRIQPWDFEQEIQFFLETFQPDLEALRLLEARYRRIAKPEQMVSLRRVYVAAVEDKVGGLGGQEAADLWLEAMGLYEKLGSSDQRLRCGREALRSDPNSVRVRESIANCLADVGEYDEAKKHFKWLVSRKPDETRLIEKLREIDRIQTVPSRQAARPGGNGAPLR